MISVIVPVVNEPPEALADLERFASAPGAELLLADGARGPRGACLARAAARAQGDIFFFLHADSRPPPDALAVIERAVAGGAAAGAFRLRYDSPHRRMRWIAWWANARARHLGLPFGDQEGFSSNPGVFVSRVCPDPSAFIT